MIDLHWCKELSGVLVTGFQQNCVEHVAQCSTIVRRLEWLIRQPVDKGRQCVGREIRKLLDGWGDAVELRRQCVVARVGEGVKC